MSALALYLEREGLSTVCIALVREHAQKMRPPRALWVPFALGRPFGPPDEPALQRKVVEAALALLEREAGPVLEDFPDDAAATRRDDSGPWVCPVSFPAPAPDPQDPATAVLDEVRALEPWYEQAVRERSRTTVGLSGKTVTAAVEYLAAQLAVLKSPVQGSTENLVDELRWSADDVKAYYFEAATAQGAAQDQEALERWFWEETHAGALLSGIREACLGQSDEGLKNVGDFMIVPDAFA